MQKPLTSEERLADLIAECYADPLMYVMRVFPWDFDQSIQMVKLDKRYSNRFRSEYGPDVWACEFLDQLGADIRERKFDGRNAVEPIRCAVASGHGIGKSVMVAWLVKFITDTRPFCKGTVTANTADQLKSKTWAEVGKWHRMSLTEHWFDYRSGRGAMALIHKQFPEKWYCNAQTCREENSEAFAGQHAADSTSFYIFDEASAIPGKIFEVRNGGLTDGEPMVFDFGNPTRNSGFFYEECQGDLAHRYRHLAIDSRSVAITNKLEIDNLIADYGIDSDYVRVRVKGEFPGEGSVQFIGSADVQAATNRELIPDRHAPLTIGVDVARFGEDDTVIYPRMGMDARSWPPRRFKGLDTVQTVGKVIECLAEFRALGIRCAGLFVDGGGVGGGVVDQLRHLGHNPIEVQFGGRPTDQNTYRYKGDELWGKLRDAIRTRLCLPIPAQPGGQELKEQLTNREYGYTLKNQIHLEGKKDMKKRLGADSSPDIADALALTFAQEVLALAVADVSEAPPSNDYDPLEANW